LLSTLPHRNRLRNDQFVPKCDYSRAFSKQVDDDEEEEGAVRSSLQRTIEIGPIAFCVDRVTGVFGFSLVCFWRRFGVGFVELGWTGNGEVQILRGEVIGY
jgi:hypothetical protein